jgi:hypothetical protein
MCGLTVSLITLGGVFLLLAMPLVSAATHASGTASQESRAQRESLLTRDLSRVEDAPTELLTATVNPRRARRRPIAVYAGQGSSNDANNFVPAVKPTR